MRHGYDRKTPAGGTCVDLPRNPAKPGGLKIRAQKATNPSITISYEAKNRVAVTLFIQE